jgi:RNA polymerase sigma-70 factor (ECF subfamily)
MDQPALALTGVRIVESARSFEDFFEAEQDRLYRALFLVCGNRQDAEELSQEAFVKVLERWDRVSGMDSPDGYLFRAAMNLFRSRYRSAARAARRIVRRGEPRDELAAVDSRDAALRALATLTPRQRAALVLTEMLGYDSNEAAEILGVKAVTVRTLAHQGREALKTTMEPNDE